MHELAVTAFFLREHGQEMARRYMCHHVIQAKKAAFQHRDYHQRLGGDPPSEQHLQRLQEMRNELVREFGSAFAEEWGWAASVIDKPNFRKIEEATKLDHLRPYYKMASHAVHPGARGSFFDLGGIEGRGLLVAGPSIYGFTDPAHGACLSLYQTTVALLSGGDEPAHLVVLSALSQLLDHVGETFLAIHREQERELAEQPRKDGETA
jgi:hypothetical protein